MIRDYAIIRGNQGHFAEARELAADNLFPNIAVSLERLIAGLFEFVERAAVLRGLRGRVTW